MTETRKTVNVLVTGAQGFLGRNLCTALRRRSDITLTAVDVDAPPGALDVALGDADVVFHLAGVNRPERTEEFETGNAALTASLCSRLSELGRSPTLVLSSSTQAELDNPYGRSKRGAEQAVQAYADATGAAVVVYRLKNLFGKWCRPNYNSVVATFCHNITRGLPIQVSNPTNVVDLTYVDDVVAAFSRHVDSRVGEPAGYRVADALPSTKLTLADLVRKLEAIRDQRTTLVLPDFSDPFTLALYATYQSYLEPNDFAYDLEQRTDNRGTLAEFVKQSAFGQVFVSRTKPGVTRGNHYHDTKCEKFLVVEGTAVVRFRHLASDQVVEYSVSGEQFRVVDIPPGYTHSIENVGTTPLVTLFWSNQVFDSSRPDTFFTPVLPSPEAS